MNDKGQREQIKGSQAVTFPTKGIGVVPYCSWLATTLYLKGEGKNKAKQILKPFGHHIEDVWTFRDRDFRVPNSSHGKCPHQVASPQRGILCHLLEFQTRCGLRALLLAWAGNGSG